MCNVNKFHLGIACTASILIERMLQVANKMLGLSPWVMWAGSMWFLMCAKWVLAYFCVVAIVFVVDA